MRENGGSLKQLVSSVPGGMKVARAVRAAVDPNIRMLQTLDIFAPNSAGSSGVRLDLAMRDANNVFPVLEKLAETLGHTLIPTTLAADFPKTDAERDASERLAVLFEKHGSDKACTHDYYNVYGTVIERCGGIKSLLEVGLGTNNTDVVSNMGSRGRPGASLRAFREHQPAADIYGADIDRRILFREERIETYFVDQMDLASFDELGKNLPAELDIVIDDGLHSPAANLAVLRFGLERVRVGGWVIVEDIAPVAAPVWRFVATLLGPKFECQLIEAKVAHMFLVNRVA